MYKLLIVAGVTLAIGSPGQAQVQQFPYKAKIVVDEAYVRSGGGEAFYPTQILKRDATVTVRRHDPGGWYMIDPPKGSFSWVPEKYVRQTSANSGEILESKTVVFVGSSFGDETHVWQRMMMAGEKVEVLGQRTLDTLSGPKNMLKIKPPTREFRWLPGSAVVPVDKDDRAQHDRNPYAVPSEIAERRAGRPPQGGTSAQNSPSAFSPSNRLARLRKIRDEQRQLHEIDQKFRVMILSHPSKWNLATIEQEYLKLQEAATHKPIAGQIDLRYPAIQRYRLRKAEFDDLKRLTSETEKRDAQLMASQYGIPQNTLQADPSSTSAVAGVSVLPPLSTPVASAPNGTSVAQNEVAGSGPPSALNIPPNSRYIGAGFLQRSAGDSESAYLLTSPTGKVLAHLKADDSVDLEKYVGRSVGLRGSRWFDPEIKGDYIEVSELEEVRIRQ